jgi:hypothetical protein
VAHLIERVEAPRRFLGLVVARLWIIRTQLELAGCPSEMSDTMRGRVRQKALIRWGWATTIASMVLHSDRLRGESATPTRIVLPTAVSNVQSIALRAKSGRCAFAMRIIQRA